MPLSWNEIRDRAITFSRKWGEETSERAEAQSFWNEFFQIFGLDRKRVAIFEKQVRLARAGEKLKTGRIDLFWKGTLLVEHKSEGVDLDRAFAQAADYFEALPERDLPRYILVSDFRRLRLYDLEAGTDHAFQLKQLKDRIKLFGFIAGYKVQEIKEQDPVNIRAAEAMGRLHDRLKAAGYAGHHLEVLLVRLLFCLFAEDTGIFQPAGAFREFVAERTAEDGTDLGRQLALLFQVLNTPEERRQRNLDERLAAFPYVNGRLFEEALPVAVFDSAARAALLDCCAVDWSAISPAVFGALFQSIMDPKARRNLGVHYTSERNILKLIKPLFLDALWEEFARVRNNRNRLFEFHKRLRTLIFFDPACGCGNFLVIAYRELRLLELEILRAAFAGGQQMLDVHQFINLDVDQFYGIEIEEFPAQIAQVALWLMDHQMNRLIQDEFGMYFARIPLKCSPGIVNGNALRLDWDAVLPRGRADYVLGNPPFVGKQYQSAEQKTDLESVAVGIKGAGVLDLVAGWYFKAADYIRSTEIRCAFVSTNSISQGEQVGVLWSWLLGQGIRIHFAHRTFQWSNEASGQAAVHCVIVGFGAFDVPRKTIFEYEDIHSEPHAVEAGNVNPYLVNAVDVVLPNRRAPICRAPEIAFGSMPNDGGYLLLSDGDKTELLGKEPQAVSWIRPFLGSDEFINGIPRWCLWLVDCPPQVLRAMPEIAKRVAAVKKHREESPRAATRQLATLPALFAEIRQPTADYVAVPKTSSERRKYIPVGVLARDVIAGTEIFTISGGGLFSVGMLSSAMHNAWVRYTCGRLKSDFRYSAGIVYNNFPWPESPTDKQKAAIEAAAQGVLDARARFPESSLADLYDPLAMPPELTRAHQKLDAAVDAAYGRRDFKSDAERVAFLFALYQKLTSLLPAAGKAARRAKTSETVAGSI